MSFRCERCNEAQPARSTPTKVVTEWHYPGAVPLDEDSIILTGGHRQIKKEISLCDNCVELQGGSNGTERSETYSAEAS